jgi:signal transduction histidine kinase
MRFTVFRITERYVLGVLALGFALVMAFLGAGGWIAVRHSQRIRSSVADLARDQLLIARLVHDVQMEENAMTEVLHQLAQFRPALQDHESLFRNLEQSDQHLSRLAQEARGIAGDAVWRDLESSVNAFTREVHRVLDGAGPLPKSELEALFTLHDHVVSLVNDLIRVSSERITATERQIAAQSEQLTGDATLLLGSSFLLSAVCAVVTIGFARKSIHRIQWQSDELDRVSWHMLQSQEQAARRFSHELHDELGQSLAVLRSNLTKESVLDPESLRADCLHLVDESIANVRELSQLLRPVILDDFGLDAGLRWLAERFAQRTRIRVDVETECRGRFADETETHLYRIAQEALTNVARHSKAGNVRIRLVEAEGNIRLSIVDDGVGLGPDPGAVPGRPSLGMVGMRARARQCGGELTVEPAEPTGLRVEAVVPAMPADTKE